MFDGEFRVSLDDEGSFTLPAPWRAAFGESVAVVAEPNQDGIMLWPVTTLERMFAGYLGLRPDWREACRPAREQLGRAAILPVAADGGIALGRERTRRLRRGRTVLCGEGGYVELLRYKPPRGPFFDPNRTEELRRRLVGLGV